MRAAPTNAERTARLKSLEQFILAKLDAANKQFVDFASLRACFDALVMDAHSRGCTDLVMGTCIVQTAKLHQCLTKLECAMVYEKKLVDLGHEDNPGLQAVTKELAAELEVLRTWAAEHTKKILECRPIGATLS